MRAEREQGRILQGSVGRRRTLVFTLRWEPWEGCEQEKDRS